MAAPVVYTMGRSKKSVKIVEQSMIATGIYRLVIQDEELAMMAKPGQFINFYTKNSANLLPRPISICQIDKVNHTLVIVYRVVGKGTDEFSKYKAGDTIDVLGTIGNGFELTDQKALLVGGGIGIPPMVGLGEALKATGNEQVSFVCGYRNDELFLKEEMEASGTLYVATDDGSVGTKGTVIDAIKANEIKPDVIYSCGPMPMLRALKAYAEENGILLYVSLEERMACGVGACLGCVCKTKEKNHHTHVNNARVCVDGPVYLASDVEI